MKIIVHERCGALCDFVSDVVQLHLVGGCHQNHRALDWPIAATSVLVLLNAFNSGPLAVGGLPVVWVGRG